MTGTGDVDGAWFGAVVLSIAIGFVWDPVLTKLKGGTPMKLAFGMRVVRADGRSVVAYDQVTGEPRWFGQADGPSYSSPHRVTIDGVAQIVLLTNAGVTSVSPADGTPLW